MEMNIIICEAAELLYARLFAPEDMGLNTLCYS